MTCKHVNENLDDFVDGTLSAAERATFEEHAIECGTCQQVISDARYLQGLLKEYGDTDVPTPDAAFFDQALLRAALKGNRQQQNRGWLKGFRVAVPGPCAGAI